MRPVLIAGVVLAGCAVGGVLRPAHSQPPKALPVVTADLAELRPYGVGKAEFAHRPATSCAAASCHGGGQVGKVGSEHSTWAPEAFPQGGSDPHSKAYRVLLNPQSVLIAKNLGLKEAHTAQVCLKCHAVETGADPAVREQVLAEGVGCSACHGPADKWISEHYLPGWKALSNREKWDQYGFVPAGNLVARTLNCASCHVGDADHDLNHDIYAAGHPPINFEAARMHHQPDYRKHWTEKTPQPDFEVRLWIVGQVATLRNAAELLRHRANRATDAKSPGPWPEFAGYSCYSCHQRIGEGDVRGGGSEANVIQPNGKPLLRLAGLPAWETTSTTAIEIAAKYCTEAYPGLSSPDLTAVRKLRETMGNSRVPDAGEVAKLAAAAVAELDKWLVAMQTADDNRSALNPARSGLALDMAHALAGNAFVPGTTRMKDHDWNALAANYLGCAAMFHASGGTAGGNAWVGELDAVRKGLRFPPGADGPFGYDRVRVDELRGQFEKLRDATGKGGKR